MTNGRDFFEESPVLDVEVARRAIGKALSRLKVDGRLSDVSDLLAISSEVLGKRERSQLENILCHHYFHAVDYLRALPHARAWGKASPGSPTPLSSELFLLMRLRRWRELEGLSREAVQRFPGESSFYSCLCRALFENGCLAEARAAGTRCLQLKQDSATRPADLLKVDVPRTFDSNDRSKNVISYSLYGSAKRYVAGALRAVRDSALLYPSWSCRFYVDDSVPVEVVRELVGAGAVVKSVVGLPRAKYGLFWRFLVCDDCEVDRYLVRDVDSRLTIRERLAVDEWMASGRHFHVMRDWITHTELILAGMWGGVGGALCGMEDLFRAYVDQRYWSRTIDQQFLREWIWPTVRQSVLVHDSQFDLSPCCPFPALSQLPCGHVGMGWSDS